jgi:hypothetical protein
MADIHEIDGIFGRHLEKFMLCYKYICYIASVNTKRDWLICSHVALDKCNVSRPGNKWKIVARPDRLRT